MHSFDFREGELFSCFIFHFILLILLKKKILDG